MTTGNTKYGITISGVTLGTDKKYSKNVDYLNLKADPQGSGISDTDAFNFGQAISSSIIGGITLAEVTRKAEYPMYPL